MFPKMRRVLPALVVLAGLALGGGFLWWRRLERRVEEAASPERVRERRVKALSFVSIAGSGGRCSVFGDGTISTLTAANGVLWSAGGSGLSDGERTLDVTAGLPSLRLSALATWRGTPVFAFERGGWVRLGEAGPERASSGWGELEVRSLVETEAGELLVGARQGLFRAAFAAGELERLDGAPVRAIALGPAGEIVAGGEQGLRAISSSGAEARPIATPDPWVDAVGVDAAANLWAATPVGIAVGRFRDDALALHLRGADASGGVLVGGSWRTMPADQTPRVASLGPDGSRSEETTPERFRRLLGAAGELFGDGPSGLWRRDLSGGWRLVRKRPESALPLPHVNALAAADGTLWAGFFDGGIARASLDAARAPRWERVEGAAWGVNALLPAGGAVFAATLQGAFRIEKGRAVEMEGAGGAFSLAATGSGIAVGYGQGVLLPEKRLLSGFHGLPGNQAYALAASPSREALWVGTPSGLGRIERRRVVQRATPGEGKLPHPWVTALLDRGDALYVATYGGGVTRRTGEGDGERWQPFVETEGLKVNAGALAADAEGRLWIGTQGRGLWRSDRAVTRFERVDVPLPSPDVFSLAVVPEARAVFAGTSEGLARLPLDEPTEPAESE